MPHVAVLARRQAEHIHVQVQLHVSRATERPPIIVAPLPEDSQFLLYTCNALLDTLEELQSENSGNTAPFSGIKLRFEIKISCARQHI